MVSAYVAAGAAKGLANVQQHERERPLRDARLEEAESQQQLSQMKLNEYSEGAPMRKTQAELELQQLRNVTTAQNRTMLRDSTYGAFRLYNADGDTRHLNNFLQTAKTNPAGQKLYGDTLRFDPVIKSPETEGMARKAGIHDIDEFFSDPELTKGFVITTQTDGTRNMVDMSRAYAGTGFTNYMTNEELTQTTQMAKNRQMMLSGTTAESNMIAQIAKDEGVSMLEATRQYSEAKNTGKLQRSSSVERIAKELRDADPELGYEESLRKAKLTSTAGSEDEREAREMVSTGEAADYKTALDTVNQRKERTTARKQLDEAAEVRTAIDEIAGGDFGAAEMDDAMRTKIGPRIQEIEKLTGKEMSQEDRRVARKMRVLTSLGKTASEEITDEETGFIDSMLKNVKKYVSDEVKGVKGTAAYEAFRNDLRNALYGSALTPSETKNFNKAAGSLGQQTGPVMQQLVTQVSMIKDQMQAIYDMNDPYVAKYYLGMDLEKVDQVIETLDDRLAMYTGSLSGKKLVPEASTKPTGERRSLQDIFK